MATSRAPPARPGAGPGQFGFPYGVALDAAGNVYVADDINHRIVKLNPELGFARAVGRERVQTRSARVPARARERPGGRHLRGGHRQRPCRGVRPRGRLPAHASALSARDLTVLTAPRGLASDPTGRLLVSDTVGNRIELFSPETDAFSGVLVDGGGTPRGLQRDQRASALTRAARSTWPTRATNGSCACGATARSSPNWAARRFKGGAQLSGAGSVAVAAATGDHVCRRCEPQPRGRLQPRGVGDREVGRRRRRRSTGRRAGRIQPPGWGRRRRRGGEVYVADTNNDRIVKLSSSGTVLTEWGSRGMSDGRFRSPAGVAVDASGERVRAGRREQSRAGVRLEWRLPGEVGRCGAPDWASSHNPARSRWTAAATCTSPTRTTTGSSVSTPSLPPARAASPGRLAAAPGRRADSARESRCGTRECSPGARSPWPSAASEGARSS